MSYICALPQTKYYKGLGTSNTDEAREYFSQIDMNRKEFVWTGATVLKRIPALRSISACSIEIWSHVVNICRRKYAQSLMATLQCH